MKIFIKWIAQRIQFFAQLPTLYSILLGRDILGFNQVHSTALPSKQQLKEESKLDYLYTHAGSSPSRGQLSFLENHFCYPWILCKLIFVGYFLKNELFSIHSHLYLHPPPDLIDVSPPTHRTCSTLVIVYTKYYTD